MKITATFLIVTICFFSTISTFASEKPDTIFPKNEIIHLESKMITTTFFDMKNYHNTKIEELFTEKIYSCKVYTTKVPPVGYIIYLVPKEQLFVNENDIMKIILERGLLKTP